MKSIGYHDKIVNLIGCCTLAHPMCLVEEFMDGGDLLKFLKRLKLALKVGLMFLFRCLI